MVGDKGFDMYPLYLLSSSLSRHRSLWRDVARNSTQWFQNQVPRLPSPVCASNGEFDECDAVVTQVFHIENNDNNSNFPKSDSKFFSTKIKKFEFLNSNNFGLKREMRCFTQRALLHPATSTIHYYILKVQHVEARVRRGHLSRNSAWQSSII